MARTIRFHLDEHVANAIARGLQRLGIDVTTTHSAGLLGASDPEQIAFANAENRVIFTEDDDFLVLAQMGISHPGIAYCKRMSRTIGDTIKSLELIWELCEPDEMRNHIEFI